MSSGGHRHPHSCQEEHQHTCGDSCGHDHGGHGHDHDHDDHPPGETLVEQTLFPYIDTTKLRCLNEHSEGAGARVFKQWSLRMQNQDSTFVESGVGCQLLFHIPFTVNVNVKSICMIASHDHGPASMKVWKNRGDMDIDDAEDSTAPDQLFDRFVPCDMTTGDFAEYHVKHAKFQNVTTLSLYFPSNLTEDEDEPTRVFYIGIKGSATDFNPRQIVETVYESRPQLSDHKTRADQFVSRTLQ